MKFGLNVANYSVCVCLILGLCNLFTFDMGNLLLHRFAVPFKCTVDETLQTLITPYSNVLRN